MIKRMFDEKYETYNTEASELYERIRMSVKNLIADYVDDYSVRDIELLFYDAISMEMCYNRMRKGIERRIADREDTEKLS